MLLIDWTVHLLKRERPELLSRRFSNWEKKMFQKLKTYKFTFNK